MSAAMIFKKRYTGGSRFHGFKKKERVIGGLEIAEPLKKIKRESGRNETDAKTRSRGFRYG